MCDNIQTKLHEIEKLARLENYERALVLIDQLAAAYPDKPEIWSTRAYVNSLSGNLNLAIVDMSKCINLRGNEPNDFFTRGRFLFKVGRYDEAILDFTVVLQLCDLHNSDYYRQAAYFFRADSYVRLNQYEKAKDDCKHIIDTGPLWTDKLRTVDQMLDECD
jgi:tetratricopeptide (TPR) repeat protein